MDKRKSIGKNDAKKKKKRRDDVCGDHIGSAGPEGINRKYKGVEALSGVGRRTQVDEEGQLLRT